MQFIVPRCELGVLCGLWRTALTSPTLRSNIPNYLISNPKPCLPVQRHQPSCFFNNNLSICLDSLLPQFLAFYYSGLLQPCRSGNTLGSKLNGGTRQSDKGGNAVNLSKRILHNPKHPIAFDGKYSGNAIYRKNLDLGLASKEEAENAGFS